MINELGHAKAVSWKQSSSCEVELKRHIQISLCVFSVALNCTQNKTGTRPATYEVRRFVENPMICPALDASLGTNINGPSLIRVPDWVADPLGRYYLYFAHHQGKFIRLAFADDLHGPWKIYSPGTLHLEQTVCHGHIGSPDVHLDFVKKEIVMYFHGVTDAGQRSFMAVSKDGLQFTAFSEVLGPFYFRVFAHDGAWYAWAKTVTAPGGSLLLRSPNGRTDFEPGPDLLPNQRHVAVRKRGQELHVFFSRGLDRPERILLSKMKLTGDWNRWQPDEPEELLQPETEYEGVALPLEPSRFGAMHQPARQLRDPAIFEEHGKTYLIYACAGESALAIAELIEK
jgi:hypothetical protein